MPLHAQGSSGRVDAFVVGRVEAMLREFERRPDAAHLRSRRQCRQHLGLRFGVVLGGMPPGSDPEAIGTELLRRCILVHLNASSSSSLSSSASSGGDSDAARFWMLVGMTSKLYALVDERIQADNPDSPMHQEVMLPGHLYAIILKEKLDDWLTALAGQVSADARRSATPANATLTNNNTAAINSLVEADYWRKRVLGKVPSDIGRKLEYFLATGNLVSGTGLDQQQVSGYTVVADRLNALRFLSHFRAVHRGAFFAELKTTTVRKLSPESWGFLCPVHTPDGAPCGLLNHLGR